MEDIVWPAISARDFHVVSFLQKNSDPGKWIVAKNFIRHELAQFLEVKYSDWGWTFWMELAAVH